MTAPRIPRVYSQCGGACQQGRTACDCYADEDNLPDPGHWWDVGIATGLVAFIGAIAAGWV